MLKSKQISESGIFQPENTPEKNEKVGSYIQGFAPEASKLFIPRASSHSSPNLLARHLGMKISKDLWKKIGIGFVAIILVILSASTFYFYREWRQTKTNPQEMAKDALSEIVAEVGSLIELPTDETPTMATVTSVEKLKDQPFFAKARNGDRALIYSQAGKAILYRPESRKIIEVISLIGNSNQLTGNQVPSETQLSTTAPETVQNAADTQTPAAETSAENPIESPAEIQ